MVSKKHYYVYLNLKRNVKEIRGDFGGQILLQGYNTVNSSEK